MDIVSDGSWISLLGSIGWKEFNAPPCGLTIAAGWDHDSADASPHPVD